MLEFLHNPFFVRNLVYGLEDSLISTTGVLVGTSVAGLSNAHVITVGIVLIFVEALSMAFGAFLSEESFLITSGTRYLNTDVVLYALTMFCAYVVAGVIVLLPYVLGMRRANVYSIVIAVISLFVLIASTQKHNITKTILLTCIGLLILLITIKVGKTIDEHNSKIL